MPLLVTGLSCIGMTDTQAVNTQYNRVHIKLPSLLTEITIDVMTPLLVAPKGFGLVVIQWVKTVAHTISTMFTNRGGFF